MTTITLTANPITGTCPNAEILLASIDAGVASVTVWRTVGRRKAKVRGMINVATAGGVSGLDFEVPAGYTASYQAEQFDSSGAFVSFSTPTAITLPDLAPNVAWFHNPLDPSTAVQMTMAKGAGAQLVRPTNAQVFQTQGRSVGIATFGTRGGLQQVVLDCYASSDAVTDAFDELFGGYDDQSTIPILCIRTPTAMRLPSPLFALVGSPAQNPVQAPIGGQVSGFSLTGDEISPPAEAVVISMLGYDDFTAFYSDYAHFTSAYADYQSATRDYSIAGTV